MFLYVLRSRCFAFVASGSKFTFMWQRSHKLFQILAAKLSSCCARNRLTVDFRYPSTLNLCLWNATLLRIAIPSHQQCFPCSEEARVTYLPSFFLSSYAHQVFTSVLSVCTCINVIVEHARCGSVPCPSLLRDMQQVSMQSKQHGLFRWLEMAS